MYWTRIYSCFFFSLLLLFFFFFSQNWLWNPAFDPVENRSWHHRARRDFHGDGCEERGRCQKGPGRHGLQHAKELGDDHERLGRILQQSQQRLQEVKRHQLGVLLHEAGALCDRAQGRETDRLDRQRVAPTLERDAKRGDNDDDDD